MFKTNEIVAINFSDASIEALQLQKAGLHYKVLCWSRLRIPPDIIEDGKILSIEKLTQAVQKLLADAKPQAIKAKEVVFSIPESKVFIETFAMLGSIKGDELRSAVEQKASELIPVEPEYIVSDFIAYPVGDRQHVVFAGTYRNVVDDYVKLFDNLGLKVFLITAESFSLIGAVIDAKQSPVTLLVDIGARTSIASVVYGGLLLESITIKKAGNDLTKAVAKQYGIGLLEAEEKKIALAATGDLQALMVQEFTALIGELKKFVQYATKRHTIKIGQILLAGGSAQLPNISTFIEEQLALPTAVAVPLEIFKLHKTKAESPTFLPILGAALLAYHRNDDYINFLPSKNKAERKKERKILQKKTTDVKQPMITQQRLVVKNNSRTRLFSLIGMLLVAGIIFGFIWWQTSTTFLSLPPGVVSADDIKRVELNYELNLFADRFVPNAIAGSSAVEILSGTFYLDDAYWQRIDRNLVNAKIDAGNSTAVYNYVMDDLMRRLWLESFDGLNTRYNVRGLYLLNRYKSYQLVSSLPKVENFNFRGNLAEITASYEVLTADAAQYNELLRTVYISAYHQPPGTVVERKTGIELLDNGNVAVTESVRY